MKITNLTKKYGNLTVYENFSLELKEGEVTCILGESGCGKTTLLNCVAGLTDYAGEITKVKCSYVFQTPRLVPNLTVGGNLKLICKDEKSIDGVLEKVRLTDKKNAYPVSLSGGQAQRASLARAFLYGGELILMDEPFSSLDLKLKKEISELFLQIQRESGRTALFVTHDVDEALSLSDRVIVINGGKIVSDILTGGNKDELRKQLISALIA
ncbi:MAG: ATP-binding cassette domain-containing protein [Clostridia bacterium]|nr:ATP-binding cassette domain-containing protein [Clostridia bacterium]